MLRNSTIALATLLAAGVIALPMNDASAKSQGRGAGQAPRTQSLKAGPHVKKSHWSASNKLIAFPTNCYYTPSGKYWCDY